VELEVLLFKCNSSWTDAYLTDLKYHQFYEAENKLLLADIGHFESERYTKNYIVEYLRKKSLILQLFYQKKIQIQLSTYRIWRIQN
jgi:putative NIF3 family GTP cyclohydrolase 1 type 2